MFEGVDFMRDMVVLINLDGATCRSVTRRLRAEHIYCKIVPAHTTADEILQQGALGVLLASGSTGQPVEIPGLAQLLACKLPVLALGDAALTLAVQQGAKLDASTQEGGVYQVSFENDDQLFAQVEDGERFLTACRCFTPGEGCTAIARTGSGVLGFRAGDEPVYGLAFVPEQTDPDATQMLINFCQSICGCTLWWSNHAFIERAQDEILRMAGEGHAVCALSGGVDSGVCALLGHAALGQRLHCLFVDTGLLRKGECEEVLSFYRDEMGLNLKLVDASAEVLRALEGVMDPAQKERVVYEHLQLIMYREIAQLPHVHLMLQGTNYSDMLESPAGQAVPADKALQMIEPVRELFKDEVRWVGEALHLPASMTNRQPFPGSGLALRILTDVTEERLAILREADFIFRREIEDAGLNKRLWQYFATLAHDPTPGAGGYVVTLRAVQVIDGHIAIASRLPYDLLERVTEAILTQLPAVHRVLYDFTPSQSYARIEWR